MFGTKWKGKFVTVHTGVSGRARRKALEEADKHGYEYVAHTYANMQFRKKGS